MCITHTRRRSSAKTNVSFQLLTTLKKKITKSSHKGAIGKNHANLNNNQKKPFRDKCFKKFLDLEEPHFNGVVGHSVLLQEIIRGNSNDEF